MRLLICAGGTGGGVYPALAVLDHLLNDRTPVQTLWVGRSSGMEADLVAKAGVDFVAIPAAGVHAVGLTRLPGNIAKILAGTFSAFRILRSFKPDVLFFTGGYVAVPVAIAGFRIPTVLFIPDIEPGLALKFLATFADHIVLTVEESKKFFSNRKESVVTGYPVRRELSSWSLEDAYRFFNFNPNLPTLVVTGGSLGSLTINKALVAILPELLEDFQVIHIAGELTWPQFAHVKDNLSPSQTERYRSFPYLHQEIGAAFRIADLILSRAGASSIGEYPHFGIPAILVPYPHAWRYQKVNADYLRRHGAAVVLEDAELSTQLMSTISDIFREPGCLQRMKDAMKNLNRQNAAKAIADQIFEVVSTRDVMRN